MPNQSPATAFESEDRPEQAADVGSGLAEYFLSWLEYRRWVQRIPGIQVALRVDGRLSASAALGTANLDTGEALSERHLFRIASHSKTFAAVSVLQLVEAGRLRLDDTLGQHLPALSSAALAGRTVGELLSHSGGVTRDSEDGDFWETTLPFPDREDLLAIAGAPSAAVLERNEHFKYSNIAFGLIGQIIEAVSGQPFPHYLAEHIAGPLGLESTGGEWDQARAGEYAAGHSSLYTARQRRVIPHVDTRALAAATGCYSTASELTAFFAALLPGDDRLMGPDSQRLQRRPRWEVRPPAAGYGLGVFLHHIDGYDLFGHSGGYPGHITCTYASADDRWVLSVLTNCIDRGAGDFAAAYVHLRALARDADHAPAGPQGAHFTGRFSSLWGMTDVALIEGRLYYLHPDALNPAEDAAPLEVVDDTTLKIVGGSGGNSYGELMRFEFNPDGSVRCLRADSGKTVLPWSPPAG